MSLITAGLGSPQLLCTRGLGPAVAAVGGCIIAKSIGVITVIYKVLGVEWALKTMDAKTEASKTMDVKTTIEKLSNSDTIFNKGIEVCE